MWEWSYTVGPHIYHVTKFLSKCLGTKTSFSFVKELMTLSYGVYPIDLTKCNIKVTLYTFLLLSGRVNHIGIDDVIISTILNYYTFKYLHIPIIMKVPLITYTIYHSLILHSLIF